MTSRCDLTELLVDQCACRDHKGGTSPEEEAAADQARVRARLLDGGDPRWFAAKFPGTCARCGERFAVGVAIRMREDLFSVTASELNWIADCCSRGAA